MSLQVHHHGHHAVSAVQQFAGFGMVQSVDAHHAVTYLQDFADFLELQVALHIPELLQQDIGHFAWS